MAHAKLGVRPNYYLDREDGENESTKIAEWVNQATVTPHTTEKLDCLRKAQEMIMKCSSNSLLDNFFEEIITFQGDRNSEVRKFCVGFMEEACKKDIEMLPNIIWNLKKLLNDPSPLVQKRVIQASISLYKRALVWICCAKNIPESMEKAWNILGQIKLQILGMADSDNDGIRTLAVKFLESVVILQTYSNSESIAKENDFSLDDVPFALKIARRRKLEEEANNIFEMLVKFHGSQHVSSVNLMTCMGSLVLIAKLRPQFMSKVVTALESVHINLPPTLSKSQVNSVRKHLKMQLLSLLKLPSSFEYHVNISALLTDLGAVPGEIGRALPKAEDIKRVKAKRALEAATSINDDISAGPLKKIRLDNDREMMIIDEEEEDKGKRKDIKLDDNTVDITEQFIFERLTPEITAQLIMASMNALPDTMPAHFHAAFTPIAAAGTPSQIRHVARLLANQITAASKSYSYQPSATPTIALESETTSEATIKSVESIFEFAAKVPVGAKEIKQEPSDPAELKESALAKLSRLNRLKSLKLADVVRPLDVGTKGELLESALQRILRSERASAQGGASVIRSKILSTMATNFHPNVREVTLAFIQEDIKRRVDLAISWLYEEHSIMQGFNRDPMFFKQEGKPEDTYNSLLNSLIHFVSYQAKLDIKDRELLLNRLFLEVPQIPESSMNLLKDLCCDDHRALIGLKLLEVLIMKRPPRQMHLLNVLLVQTSHESSFIRGEALERVVNLYKKKDLSAIIEEYSVVYLNFLKLSAPPDVLFGVDRGRPIKVESWTEETIRVCLYLFMAVLPYNGKMISELAKVYTATSPEVKRVIFRLLEQPVKEMGTESPDLLNLVKECPKGAETLVTRIVHILTDRAPPSEELVSRVRDLYNTRVSDVRFLIPVLNGLRKEEVIAALPKLIKLNPVVVKEVFNRLLGTHQAEAGIQTGCALSPADLLVALHCIDHEQCDLKLVIKATSLCFAEKHIYTQEIMAQVLQTLMEIHPLPTLLMRTAIQALTTYPRLIGFIMIILQRLITKKVWTQKKVWEGFIKCCQRTRPQSFQVLLQLPPQQIIDVFMECPELQKPLLDHVMTFTEHQRKHISKMTMEILRGNKLVVLDEDEIEFPPVQPPSQPVQLPIVEIKKEKEGVADADEDSVPQIGEASAVSVQ